VIRAEARSCFSRASGDAQPCIAPSPRVSRFRRAQGHARVPARVRSVRSIDWTERIPKNQSRRSSCRCRGVLSARVGEPRVLTSGSPTAAPHRRRGRAPTRRRAASQVADGGYGLCANVGIGRSGVSAGGVRGPANHDDDRDPVTYGLRKRCWSSLRGRAARHASRAMHPVCRTEQRRETPWRAAGGVWPPCRLPAVRSERGTYSEPAALRAGRTRLRFPSRSSARRVS
jgi:hypothetical protein